MRGSRGHRHPNRKRRCVRATRRQSRAANHLARATRGRSRPPRASRRPIHRVRAAVTGPAAVRRAGVSNPIVRAPAAPARTLPLIKARGKQASREMAQRRHRRGRVRLRIARRAAQVISSPARGLAAAGHRPTAIRRLVISQVSLVRLARAPPAPQAVKASRMAVSKAAAEARQPLHLPHRRLAIRSIWNMPRRPPGWCSSG